MRTRHARTIARTELRRRWRTLKDNPAQLIALGIVAMFALPASVMALFGLFAFGAGIAAGDIEAPLDVARLGTVYLWLFVLAFGGYRAYSTVLRPDRLDGMLTTVSHRDLLGGLFYAEALLWGVPSMLLALAGGIAFAAGAGSPLAVPFVALTVGSVLLTALVGGFGVALAVRNAGVRSRLLARLRTLLFVLLGIAYVGVVFTGSFDAVLTPLYLALEPTPVGWFGDLLLFGTVAEAAPLRGAGVVLASVAFLTVGAIALSRLAAWLWYADTVHTESDSAAASRSSGTRLDAFLPRPIVGVVITDYKRARRSPLALSFLIYPLLVLIGPTMTTIQTGTIVGSLPLWVLFCGAWITGAVFSLNVLGNEGAVLPATLLGASPGRTLVGGHVIAAAIIGIPLTVLATSGLALAGPQSVRSAATLSGSALLLAAMAAPLATGIGAMLPRFEEVTLGRSTKAIVPSTLAFAVYSLCIGVFVFPTLAGHSALLGGAVASWAGTSVGVVQFVGMALTALAAVPAGVLSVRYAVRAVEGYHL